MASWPPADQENCELEQRKSNLVLIYPIRYNEFKNADYLLSYTIREGTRPRISLRSSPSRPSDRSAAADVLDAIREHGLHAPGVRFKQIRGKLWEFYIEAGASHRIFYVVITGPLMVLLHSYKKQSQKAPAIEIKIAERRMKEVLHES